MNHEPSGTAVVRGPERTGTGSVRVASWLQPGARRHRPDRPGDEREGASVKGPSPDFEEFVMARGPRLLRAAWLLTGDAHLAEDLLQTVLAKLWPKWHRIAEGNPEAYARKALVNTFSSWWQRRWRGEVPHGEVPESAAADGFAAVDLQHSLAAAVRSLPPRQRAVVVLRYFEDLSVEETAEVLGCRAGTVKSQSVKALRALRGMPALRTHLEEENGVQY